MRQEWSEYPGKRWLVPPDMDEESDGLGFDEGPAGGWDRYLRQTHQQYATGY